MRPLLPAALLFGLAAGACRSLTEGNPPGATYALHRIGTDPLPARLDPGPDGPLVLADTLVIPPEVVSPDGAVITHVRVTRFGAEPPHRDVHQLEAVREQDVLSVNECPVGWFCVATLIAAYTTFQVVGDSLFEQVESESTRKPRVYGVVSARPRN